MSDLIARYGYLAVLIGTLLEGETILILGAVAAKLGYLKIGLVILAALVGSFAGDQAYFLIGRRYGHRLVARWPSWRMRVARATALLERYDTWFILGFRFIYGLRSISPFVVGMSAVPSRKFVFLNFLAALLWATAIGAASFALGAVIESVIHRFQVVEHYALLAIAGVGFLVWAAHWIRVRYRTRSYVRKEGSRPSR